MPSGEKHILARSLPVLVVDGHIDVHPVKIKRRVTLSWSYTGTGRTPWISGCAWWAFITCGIAASWLSSSFFMTGAGAFDRAKQKIIPDTENRISGAARVIIDRVADV